MEVQQANDPIQPSQSQRQDRKSTNKRNRRMNVHVLIRGSWNPNLCQLVHKVSQSSNHQEQRKDHQTRPFPPHRKSGCKQRNDRNGNRCNRDSILPVRRIRHQDQIDHRKSDTKEEGELEENDEKLIPEKHVSYFEIRADLLIDDPTEFLPELETEVEHEEFSYTACCRYHNEVSFYVGEKGSCTTKPRWVIWASDTACDTILNVECVSDLSDLDRGCNREGDVEYKHSNKLHCVFQPHCIPCDQHLEDAAEHKDCQVDRDSLEVLREVFDFSNDASEGVPDESDDDCRSR